MRISDWSSDVCSSDLHHDPNRTLRKFRNARQRCIDRRPHQIGHHQHREIQQIKRIRCIAEHLRSEEHTSELQSLMRISYAVFCLKKKNTTQKHTTTTKLTQQNRRTLTNENNSNHK